MTFTAEHQVVSADPWRSGCGWDETFSLTVPPDWTSGIYSAACTDSTGGRCAITFVVKPADDRRSRIAVLANVNTWLAYNGWGGQSKYSGLARTSFLRPMPLAAPDGDPHLTRGELWILGWLKNQDHSPDVFTDIDFHNDGCDPAQYPLLIVGTHPEYWTPQMYDQLVSYLVAGGSLAYLGGNGVFEIGEYDSDQTQMVFRSGCRGRPPRDRPLPDARQAGTLAPGRRHRTLRGPGVSVRGASFRSSAVRRDGPVERGRLRRLRPQQGARQRQGQRLGGRHQPRPRRHRRPDGLLPLSGGGTTVSPARRSDRSCPGRAGRS